MDAVDARPWSPPDYCIAAAAGDASGLAREVYDRVCRTDFLRPGFCLIDLGAGASSESLRRLMVALKRGLQAVHLGRTGRDLVYLSAGRFDQQVSTKLHRDGGPDESLLILGYEPSEVRSELALADYSRCAFEMGLAPAELLEIHNPMFAPGERLLMPYTTPVACFSNRRYQIVAINNSVAPFSGADGGWQGVLHTATVNSPSDPASARRVVNSTMVASVSQGAPEVVTAAQQDEFMVTRAVRRRGYDKPRLEDDA
jgi:hypothetical protein